MRNGGTASPFLTSTLFAYRFIHAKDPPVPVAVAG
jgi:hypothetical protein